MPEIGSGNGNGINVRVVEDAAEIGHFLRHFFLFAFEGICTRDESVGIDVTDIGDLCIGHVEIGFDVGFAPAESHDADAQSGVGSFCLAEEEVRAGCGDSGSEGSSDELATRWGGVFHGQT